MLSFLIVIFTIIISSQGDLMLENVTGVSMMNGMHIWVILLIWSSALFYTYKMHWIYKQLVTPRKYIHNIINITCLAMCLGVIFPYTLNSRDILSQLHVYLSMFPSFSFLILLFVYNRFLSYENACIYNEIHWYYDLGLQFLGIFFVVFTRVNGYLEIMFVILVTSYLYILERKLKEAYNEESI